MPNTALQYISAHPQPTASEFVAAVSMYGAKAVNDAIAIRPMMNSRAAAARKALALAKQIDPTFLTADVLNMSIPAMEYPRKANPIWDSVIEQVRIYRRLDGRIYRAKKKAGFIEGQEPSK